MCDSTPSPLPAPVTATVESWLGHHDRLAPGVVEGLYLVGSVALDDWTPSSDVDVVAFVADPTDAEVVERLEAAHQAYRSEAGLPTVDGPFLSWSDVTTPPLASQRPWSLDGLFRFDGDCFEINPITWFTLAQHGIAVRGPSPGLLDVHLDAADRRAWVGENVDTYWRSVRDEIAHILAADAGRTEFDGGTLEWCALGVARMWFSAETGGVASKQAAGEWAAQRLPEHASVLADAIAVRSGRGVTVDRATIEALVDAMGSMIDRIV